MNFKRLYRPELLMAEVLRQPRQPTPRPSERDLALLHDQQLRSACGFCTTPQLASQLRRRLMLVHGLLPSQLCQLAPGRRGRMQFHRLVRQWQAQRDLAAQLRGQCSPLAGACIGMALGALLAATWLVLDSELSELVQIGIAGATVLAGGALGWAAMAATGRRLPGPRFDRTVLRHLRARQHAVLVHGVPSHQQAAVLGCLQDNSLVWCAETANALKLG